MSVKTSPEKKKQFRCGSCKHQFEAIGLSTEYNHSLYGPCVSYKTNCPECGSESSEYIDTNTRKAEIDTSDYPCGGNPNNCPSCPN